MPLFVILGNFTQKRVETIKGLPESVKEGVGVFESFGVKIRELVFTMGRYDLVAIGEAPDAEAITKALLSWSSKGLLRTETLMGFTAEKMIELVQAT
ncbi:MAG: GYD domain-containing protein [Candidatus Bathyarchaeota archaeon]|nr:GYD domain-containing protein [Candidatus Bathyarchaeota archaeon]